MGEFTDNLVEQVEGWAKWKSDAKVSEEELEEIKETAREIGEGFERTFGTEDEVYSQDFYDEFNLDYSAKNDDPVTMDTLASLIITDHIGWGLQLMMRSESDVGSDHGNFVANEDFKNILEHYEVLAE